MANERICEICGEPIKRLDGYAIKCNGVKGLVCNTCNVQLDNLQYKHYKEEGIRYLNDKLNQGKATSLGREFIESRFGKYRVYQEPAYTESSEKDAPAYTPAPEEPSTGNGLMLSGVIFLILAVILYIVSIQNVNGLQIANIQGTVFCAASFIVSMVCFACKTVITACQGKIDAQTATILKEIRETRQESDRT